jgi:hypothetical protein
VASSNENLNQKLHNNNNLNLRVATTVTTNFGWLVRDIYHEKDIETQRLTPFSWKIIIIIIIADHQMRMCTQRKGGRISSSSCAKNGASIVTEVILSNWSDNLKLE